MNLSEIRSELRSTLNDPEPTATRKSYWTDAQLNTKINVAAGQIYSTILQAEETYFRKEFNFSPGLEAGRPSYFLPLNFSSIARFEHYEPTTLLTTDLIIKYDQDKHAGLLADSGKPLFYDILEQYVIFLPTPDDAYTVRIIYDAVQENLSAPSDVPNMPIYSHYMIVLLAANLALMGTDRYTEQYMVQYMVMQNNLIKTILGRTGKKISVSAPFDNTVFIGDSEYVESYTGYSNWGI